MIQHVGYRRPWNSLEKTGNRGMNFKSAIKPT